MFFFGNLLTGMEELRSMERPTPLGFEVGSIEFAAVLFGMTLRFLNPPEIGELLLAMELLKQAWRLERPT